MKKLILNLLLLVFLLSACGADKTGPLMLVGVDPSTPVPVTMVKALPERPLPDLPAEFPKIDRQPEPLIFFRDPLSSLPAYDPEADPTWQVDLRLYDLSALDLRNATKDLMYASFDDRTIWPPADKMPTDYDYRQVMELGRNPGLRVRELHQLGITGKGVGIAIIDQPLLVNHEEYVHALRLYEETSDVNGDWLRAQLHGPAVASIAVGKSVGVAPGADLYFIASVLGVSAGSQELDFTFLAGAVRRVVEINRRLPEGRKIRVISMSIGWSSDMKGYDAITAAVAEAKAEGMLVVCSSIEDPAVHGLKFDALGRSPLADPDLATSYGPGLFWANMFWDQPVGGDRLLVPMDSRTTASFTGDSDYVFYRAGGWSWAIPYIAGTYALAAQVDPTITPERFWQTALETGTTLHLKRGSEERVLGPILDPVALVAALQKATP